MAGLAGYLDERLDRIAIEERKLLPVRILLTFVAGGITAANIDVGAAVLCVSVILACEFFERIVTRPLVRGVSPKTLDRLLYVVAISAISGAWLIPYILWWLTGQKSLQFIAILSLNAQMIHVQAFMFRSPLALAIGTVMPAVTLVVLLIGYSNFSGLELLSIMLACNSTIGYVLYSAHRNIVSTRMIEQSRSAFQHLANTDPLTGLPNRRRFTELLRDAISNAEPNSRQFSLLLIDLDKFKAINDTVGHDAGDAVLVEAAGRLRQAIGENGVVARLGGDEFAVLLPGPATAIAGGVRPDRCGLRAADRLCRTGATHRAEHRSRFVSAGRRHRRGAVQIRRSGSLRCQRRRWPGVGAWHRPDARASRHRSHRRCRLTRRLSAVLLIHVMSKPEMLLR